MASWISNHESDPWNLPDWVTLTTRLLDSYEHWTNKPLIARNVGDALRSKQLFEAPFVVLAHDAASDPVFCYGNQTALDLWEVDLATLLRMPSRLSAEADHRSNRSQMLHRGLTDGFISDYEGVRISSTGKRFRISGATIWNVLDASLTERIGQAATFSTWQAMDV